jgi:hypothetical protein
MAGPGLQPARIWVRVVVVGCFNGDEVVFQCYNVSVLFRLITANNTSE